MLSSAKVISVRPDRAIVKKAIVETGGNLSRASAILGCSRQTLYTWCYQLSLVREAGIRPVDQPRLDRQWCMDRASAQSEKTFSRVSNHGTSIGSTVPGVEAVSVREFPVQATIKLPESLWKRVKIEAIHRGCTVSEYTQHLFEAALRESE